MGTQQEYDPARRDLVFRKIPLAIGGIAFALSGCQVPQLESLVTPPKKERKDSPESGDIIFVDNKPYLLRNDKRYPIPDLEKYRRYTKLDQYGRKVITSPGESYRNYPLVESVSPSAILDWMIGLSGLDPKAQGVAKEKLQKKLREGGEMLVFFPGFMTEKGEVYDVMKPYVDTFTTLIKGLAPKKWGLEDCLFFNYGEKLWIDEYPTQNTARSPEENIRHALEFLKTLKEEFPFIQFNLIGHSLGGLFALAATMEHYDAINNLILINSPIKGIEGTWGRRLLTQSARPLLRVWGVEDEKVTSYLFNLWGDKAYQRRLEDFVSFFTSIGRKISVVVDENDSIVPLKSASLEKAAEVRLRGTGRPQSLWDPTLYIRYLDASGYVIQAVREGLEAHGRPLIDRGVIDYSARQLGEDLADAA